VNSLATFQSWLDYVDTYLAVWVMGYEKGKNLCSEPVCPPHAADKAGSKTDIGSCK